MTINSTLGPDGYTVSIPAPVSGGGAGVGNTFVMLGESLIDYATKRVTVGSLTTSGGVATVVATSHGLLSGYHTLRTATGVSADYFNGRWLMTRADANTLTFAVPAGAPASGTGYSIHQEFRRTDVSWFDWANWLLDGRMELIYNAGGGGESTVEMLARFQAQAVDLAPQNIALSGGRNDITRGYLVSDIIGRIVSMYKMAKAAGIRLWFLSVPPVESGHAAYSARNSYREWQINKWAKAFAANNTGFIYVPSAESLVNPASPGGAAAAAMLNATDHVHWTPKGARAVGAAFAAVAEPLLPAIDWRAAAMTDDHTVQRALVTSASQSGGIATYNVTAHGFIVGEQPHIYGATQAEYNGRKTILSVTANSFTAAIDSGAAAAATGTLFASLSDSIGNNPTMQGSAGTVSSGTGSAPDNWTVSKTGAGSAVTWSVVARSDGRGNNLSGVATFTADNDNIKAVSASLQNRIAMGQRCYAVCDLSLSGMSGIKAVSANFQATIDGVTYICEPLANSLLGATYFDQADIFGVLRTPYFDIPIGASMTSLLLTVQVSAGAAGGVTMLMGPTSIVWVDPSI